VMNYFFICWIIEKHFKSVFFSIITYLIFFVFKMGHCLVIVCSIWFITLERDISLPSGRVFFGSGNFII